MTILKDPIEKIVPCKPHKWWASFFYIPGTPFPPVVIFLVFLVIGTHYNFLARQLSESLFPGFWVIIYLIIFILLHLKWSKELKEFMALIKTKDAEPIQSVCFSEEGFRAAVEGYVFFAFLWTSLSYFKETKKGIRMILGGKTWVVQKKKFDDSETEKIVDLLRRKLDSPETGPEGNGIDPIKKEVPIGIKTPANKALWSGDTRYTRFYIFCMPFILLGLEVWHKISHPDTTYVALLFAGIWLLLCMAFFLKRYIMSQKRQRQFAGQAGDIKQKLSFTKDGYELQVEGVRTVYFPWASLTSFREYRNSFHMMLCANDIKVHKKHFSKVEIEHIRCLLKNKQQLFTPGRGGAPQEADSESHRGGGEVKTEKEAPRHVKRLWAEKLVHRMAIIASSILFVPATFIFLIELAGDTGNVPVLGFTGLYAALLVLPASMLMVFSLWRLYIPSFFPAFWVGAFFAGVMVGNWDRIHYVIISIAVLCVSAVICAIPFLNLIIQTKYADVGTDSSKMPLKTRWGLLFAVALGCVFLLRGLIIWF